MLLRTEIGEQLIRYTPPGRPNRTDFATFAWEVSIKDKNHHRVIFGKVYVTHEDSTTHASGIYCSYSLKINHSNH